MIFIGFGFLMTFIKTMSWTALSYNWIISIWAFQFALLGVGFWHQVIGGKTWEAIEINLESMIIGDFGAGAAMITFGVLLGKINLQ
jgi:ammonium transporter Rh